MCLYVDYNDNELFKKIDNINPISGYCLFVDLVGSTILKDNELKKWIVFIQNTFVNTNSMLFHKFKPIKSIGDELMFFIPDGKMENETPLTLFDSLCNIISSGGDKNFNEVKIGICYCKEVYPITFIKKTPDVYGKEIDLAARLVSVAGANEIVMNEDFYEKIKEEYDSIGNKDQFSIFNNILGPWKQEFKGFKDKIIIYKSICI
jgi:class 3 adenylate cyclase